MWTLHWREPAAAPVWLQGLDPQVAASATLAELATWPIRQGQRQRRLADLFRLAGDPTTGQLQLLGDARPIQDLGWRQSGGIWQVYGPAGAAVGAYMTGGRLEIHGTVGRRVGLGMRGGTLLVTGAAGAEAGAELAGGILLIAGAAAAGVSWRQRRGLVVVTGACVGAAGLQMKAGTLLLLGHSQGPIGLGMKRGTIYCQHLPVPAPTAPAGALTGTAEPHWPSLLDFRYSNRGMADFLTIYFRTLQQLPLVPPEVQSWTGPEVWRFIGDPLYGGRGEVLCAITAAT